MIQNRNGYKIIYSQMPCTYIFFLSSILNRPRHNQYTPTAPCCSTQHLEHQAADGSSPGKRNDNKLNNAIIIKKKLHV